MAGLFADGGRLARSLAHRRAVGRFPAGFVFGAGSLRRDRRRVSCCLARVDGVAVRILMWEVSGVGCPSSMRLFIAQCLGLVSYLMSTAGNELRGLPSAAASKSLGRRPSWCRESDDLRGSVCGRPSDGGLGLWPAGDAGLDAPARSASLILAMAGSGGDAEAVVVFLFL